MLNEVQKKYQTFCTAGQAPGIHVYLSDPVQTHAPSVRLQPSGHSFYCNMRSTGCGVPSGSCHPAPPIFPTAPPRSRRFFIQPIPVISSMNPAIHSRVTLTTVFYSCTLKKDNLSSNMKTKHSPHRPEPVYCWTATSYIPTTQTPIVRFSGCILTDLWQGHIMNSSRIF